MRIRDWTPPNLMWKPPAVHVSCCIATHTLIHIAQWAVPFYVTRWRVLVCDLVTSNRKMIQRKGTANGFTTYNNQFLLNAGTHRWSDGASTTKHSFVSQRLLDGRWPPASTIKDKKPRLLSIRTCWLCVFGTDCDTHKPPTVGLFSTLFDAYIDLWSQDCGSIPL